MFIKRLLISIIDNFLKVIFILKFILKKCFEYSVYLSIKVYNNINNKSILSLTKSVCFLMIIYHACVMTKQYLNYEYDYKYNVTHNVGYYLPPISVCTQSNVFYDKNYINAYFDMSKQFEQFNNTFYDQKLKDYKRCMNIVKNNKLINPYGFDPVIVLFIL